MIGRITAAALLLAVCPAAAQAGPWHEGTAPPGIRLGAIAVQDDGTMVGIGDAVYAAPAGRPLRLQPDAELTRDVGWLLSANGSELLAVDNLGEVFASRDHGATWSMTGEFGQFSSSEGAPEIAAWAIDPTDLDHLLRVHSDGVTQRSQDGGATWLSAYPLPPPADGGGHRDGSATINDGVAYVAVEGHLWRLPDAAAPWQRLPDPPDGALSIRPAAPGVLWISGSTGAFRSTDGGLTWRKRTGRVDLLTPSPEEPGVAWAMRNRRIRLTEDGGATWRVVTGLPVVPGAPVAYVAPIAVVPGAHATLCAATGGGVWCSAGGRPFVADLSRITATTDGFHDFAPDPGNPDHGLALTDGMAWETTDGARTWHVVDVPAAYAMSVAVTRAAMAIGTQDGVVTRRRGARDWHLRSGPRGPTTVMADPLTGTLYAVAAGRLWRASATGRFRRVAARGVHGAIRANLLPLFIFDAFLPIPNVDVGGRGRTVIVFTRKELLASTDAGASFHPLAPDGPAVWAVADPRDPMRILATAKRGGLYVTADGGETWRRLNSRRPDGIAPDHDRRGRWFAIWDGRIRVSSDGGRTWRPFDTPPVVAENFCCTLRVAGGRVWWLAGAGSFFTKLRPRVAWRPTPR